MTEPPHALVAQLQDGRCVLVAGDDHPAAFQAPTRRDAIAAMAPVVLDGEPDAERERVARMPADELNALAELLTAELTGEQIAAGIGSVVRRWQPRPAPQWARSMAELPFTAVVSLNWDDSFERLLAHRSPLVLLPTEPPPPDDGRLVIFKPLGDAKDRDSLFLSLADFDRRFGWGSDFGQLLTATLATNTALFAGARTRTITELFGGSGLAAAPSSHRHYALLSGSSPIEGRVLQARLDVHDLAVEDEEHAHRFLGALHAGLAARPGRASPRPEHPVRRLRLSNIGPFRTLEVDLADDWTVLLGDNGAGKSTVLRALAFALSGTDVVSDDANHLLTTGAKEGAVELTVGETRYRTHLVRRRAGIQALVGAPTPVQTGELLALGFPAFRGVSRKAPTGPHDDREAGAAFSADLTALRRGRPDARFDDLQQWLVNLAAVTEGRHALGDADDARARIDAVFALWQELMPNVPIEYAGLDVKRWEVLVRSRGLTVPLHAVSQGALSTVAWVGTLVKRLIDRHGPAEDWAAMPGLVIIDELDAHLHPEWQRLIVPRMRAALPNVQVIATTHSPLIVGALGPGEVLTLHRDAHGDGTAERPPAFRGWRADQILTSTAFGLDTSRDAESERTMERYQALLAAPDTDPRLLAELERQLAGFPRHGETQAEREAAELVDAALEDSLREVPDDRRAELVRQAAEYLRRVRGGG